MTVDAILMMLIVLGAVWGGFVFTMRTAMRREREKVDQ